MLVAEVISRVRNLAKEANPDAFITDRMLYSIINKHAKLLIKREDGTNKIMRQKSIFKPVRVDLQEYGLAAESPITIYRTEKRVTPLFMEGYFGRLIYSVSSVDGLTNILPTTPKTYQNLSNTSSFKYNKNKYYWEIDGYLYFPNLHWPSVKIIGVPEDNISDYYVNSEDECKPRQQLEFNVSGYLLAEIEQNAMKDLAMMIQIPPDLMSDNKNIARG